MADLHVFPNRLEIRLTRAEKVLAHRREAVVISRERISSVAITADPWIWIRGIRAPGVLVPLTLAVGTWKFHGGKDFLLIKGKRRPAVVIDLDGHPGEGAGATETDRGTGVVYESDAESVTGTGAETEAGGPTDAAGFVRVIVSTTHATRLIEALRLAGSDDDVELID